MRSFAGRTAAVFVVLLLVFLGGSVWYLTAASEDFALRSLTDQLAGQAGAVATAALPLLTAGDRQAVVRLAQDTAATLGARVTIVDRAGEVWGDSHHDPAGMDNHAQRVEVKDALAGGRGTSIRFSSTLDRRMLYVAVPIGGPGEPLGVARVAWSLQQVDQWLSSLTRRAIWVTALALLAATGGSILAARQLAEPLRQIRQTVADMARGDFSGRLYLRKPREVAEVANGLNLVASRLQESIDQLQERTRELSTLLENMADGVVVTDRYGTISRANPAALRLLGSRTRTPGARLAEVLPHAEVQSLLSACPGGQPREVVLQHEDFLLRLVASPIERGCVVVVQDLTPVRRLETMRRDFVANLSHEIRTPLAVIKALAETLEKIGDPAEARPFLNQMSGQVDRLVNLTRRLLELARLESGQANVNLRPCRLDEIVRSLIQALAPVAGAKGLTVQANFPSSLPPVLADAELLRELLSCLLDNAVKFTPAGGRVEIGACGQDTAIKVWVKDTGRGISRDEQERIFERFYKGERLRSGSGSGLGLAIAKHIALIHGGRIWVESEPERGSTFFFTLPAASAAGPLADSVQA